MPQIDFFFDQEDERTLVEFVLARGGWLVASRQSSATYERIESWEAFLAARIGGGQKWALENERLFFVLSESYRLCPLELHRIDGGYYKGTYSVSQRVGGPAITLLTSVESQENGRDTISDGCIAYYPTYQNTISSEMEHASKALVQEFKELGSHLKKHSRLIKSEWRRKYLIGPHTYRRIQEGTLRLGVAGLLNGI